MAGTYFRSVVVAATVFAASTPAARSGQLTVATYNIHHGVPMAGGAIDLPRIAEVLRAMNADVIALEEVDVKTGRAGKVDQAAELARLTGMHHAFGPAMPFSGGEYGNAILCKTAILSVTNHPLPGIKGAEPRAALEITFRPRAGDPEVRFISTHLDNGSAEGRLLQIRHLNTRAAAVPPGHVILAGDLNAEPGSAEIKTLLETWDESAPVRDPTWPADRPRERIDHILQRKPAGLTARDSRVVDEPGASDHRPLLTILDLPGQ